MSLTKSLTMSLSLKNLITYKMAGRLLLASCLVSPALPLISAKAQDGGQIQDGAQSQNQRQDEASTTLEPIIITARKREENIKDVPASVHVETAESLEEKRIIDGASALRDVAGASAGIFGDRSNSFVVMRGVGPILTPLSPDDSSVLTFVDGAPLPIGASFSSYLDLARVEVMKGPQNTLFGRNTSGGAINLIPAEPSHEFAATIRGEFGSDGIYRAETMVNGTIIPDILAGRIAIRRNGENGFIDNLVGDKLGKDSSFVGRGSLLFTPNAENRWLISIQGENSKVTPITYIAYHPFAHKLGAQNLGKDDSKIYLINSRFEHDFETVTFTAQTSYSKVNNYNIYNYPDALLAADISGLSPQDFLDPKTNFSSYDKRDTRFSQEFRLSSMPQANISWLTGFVFYQDKAMRDNSKENWYYGPSATGTSIYNTTTTGQAIFGEMTYPIAEKLKLSVGGRATHESKKFDSQFFSDGLNGAIPYFEEHGKEDYKFLTGRAALSYNWTKDIMSYASISRGYKSGGFGQENALNWQGVARKPYGSSNIITYELGSRAALLENRLELTAAAFFNDMHDEQIMVWDYQNVSGYNVNIDAQSAGFELDGKYLLGKYFILSGGVAYTTSKLRNVSQQISDLQEGIRSGNKLPSVPLWSGKAAIEYHAFGEDLGLNGFFANKEFNARLGYNYLGTRYTNATNTGKLNPAHIVSARFGLDWGSGEFYVFGDNLLNKQYLNIKEYFGTNADGQSIFGVSYARGATYGAGIAVRF
ncbi:TonB-dependent receptor (plasmid) [Bartonella sp. HY329]|uniref:TonB-dependent receptor n=1 Tax=unclassified Bartonella TaxID=2645622 RepID=UPI0021C7A089|nr:MULTISPECIES: TonB-dependent receptor [unclassified Bartonella]UXM96479.1 TonB-dependent receptor [Bartonella sp. HY329]UXN10802.1 TonB-dependent receptor [Bartonella sp. HY328]